MTKLPYNILKKHAIVDFYLLLLTLSIFFVSTNAFADIITTEQGDLVKTDPIVSDTGMDYSTNSNGVRLEVFGYAVEPEFDGDPNYDYFLFKIHGTIDAASDWAPNASGLVDPNGPTMGINVDTSGNAIILSDEVEPSNYIDEPSATTVNFQIEATDPIGIVTAGFGVSYQVPKWQADTLKVTDTEIDWVAASNSGELELDQAYTWAFSFAISVPQGTESVVLDITIVGNFWQNCEPSECLDHYSTDIHQAFLMPDTDGDGYVDQSYNGNDCNDNDVDINPDALETCNNTDDNCDGSADEDLTRTTTCGSGECAGNTGAETCTAGTWGGDTCDPVNGATTEVCDNIDNDCDGSVDEGLDCVCNDGDTRTTSCGVGECAGNTGTETCSAGNWGGNTCDPYNGATAEICDNMDNNCDGSVDEGLTINTYYNDADGDGYGDPNDSLVACSQPNSYVPNNEDNCPGDTNKYEAGLCGCGTAEGLCDQTPASLDENNNDDDDDVDNYTCFIRTLV
jgi:hypothetical protein